MSGASVSTPIDKPSILKLPRWACTVTPALSICGVPLRWSRTIRDPATTRRESTFSVSGSVWMTVAVAT